MIEGPLEVAGPVGRIDDCLSKGLVPRRGGEGRAVDLLPALAVDVNADNFAHRGGKPGVGLCPDAVVQAGGGGK